MTQVLAYQGIMKRLPPHHRATILETLHCKREAIHTYNGLLKTNETIWTGIQQHTIQTHVKQFLYKAMHGTQKVGNTGNMWKITRNVNSAQHVRSWNPWNTYSLAAKQPHKD